MSTTEQEILDLEARRVAATNAADADALADILHEDYVHIGGLAEQVEPDGTTIRVDRRTGGGSTTEPTWRLWSRAMSLCWWAISRTTSAARTVTPA